MKYELNTPYDFDVKNVISKDNDVTFEVEVGGYLFPVKGFPEQVKDSVPSVISCRIQQDKDRNAYLLQNEASYYPIIYKANHRYIFEVVNIKEDHVLLQDKYGLLHAMEKDGTILSLNEIIVRCVNVIEDNNGKAHLTFYYAEPTPVEIKKEPIKPKNVVLEQPNYPPTIFEQDPPKHESKSNQVFTRPLTSKVITETQAREVSLSQQEYLSVSKMLSTKKWNVLRTYLDENLKGGKIPQIQKEIASEIGNYTDSEPYWEAIHFFIDYDAHMFLGTLSRISLSFIPSNIDNDVLDDIIAKSFACTDKLISALNLLKPCGKLLTASQSNYILTKCATLNNCEGYYAVFKFLRLSPDDAVRYLFAVYDNPVAVYTIYKFYLDADRAYYLDENSKIESFRPSKIKEYCSMLERSNLFPAEMVACMIKKDILGLGNCPIELKSQVAKKGLLGFQLFLATKKRKSTVKDIISSYSIGDMLDKLSFVKEIDNYYVFMEKKTSTFALLAKELTTRKPNRGPFCRAKIVKIMRQNKRVVWLVSQMFMPPPF